MEVRCGGCSKLFRVADEKISGAGIKFKCSQCGEYIKITGEDFEQYKLSKATVEALDMFVPKPKGRPAPAPPPEQEEQKPPSAAPEVFSFEEPFAETAPPQDMGPAPEPAPAVKPEPPREAVPEPKPVFQPETKPAPAEEISPPAPETPAGEAEPDMDLEKLIPSPLHMEAAPEPALTAPVMPSQPSEMIGMEPLAPEADLETLIPSALDMEAAAPEKKAVEGAVHPFASGPAAGMWGGLVCAVPVSALLIYGMGVLIKYAPFLSQMPVYLLAAISSAGLIGLGILVSSFISVVEAGLHKKIFFLLNMILGAVLGAIVGAVHGIVASLPSSGGIDPAVVSVYAAGCGIASFIVGIPVVIARAIMLSGKTESFSARMSGVQFAGLVFSVMIIGFAVYGSTMLSPHVPAIDVKSLDLLRDIASIEGLNVVNQTGAIDENGDLVITGTVENATDRERTFWYVVADVYDAQGALMTQAKIINGRQLFMPRDYDVMSRRGIDPATLQRPESILPPRGAVNYEMRILEPPAGIASFFASIQQYDPFKEIQQSVKVRGR